MVDIALSDYGGWGVAALIAITVWIMLLRGDLVPGGTAKLWLQSWQVEREAGKRRDEHLETLLEGQETTNKLIAALHEAATEDK